MCYLNIVVTQKMKEKKLLAIPAIHCQVFGTKLFRMFPKSQTEYLSAYDVSTLLNNTSEIDLTQRYEKVVKAHPQCAQARGYQCLVQPGDLLYIPERCWHFVRSETVSCSVSFWFK